MRFWPLISVLFFLSTVAAFADEPSKGRPDSHAPIGVMGDHLHKKGEFMASYRYMTMNMKGNLSGTRSLSTTEVLNSYPIAPLEMTMEMHMVGLMYAPSNSLTLMAMLPIVDFEMDHVTRLDADFKTEASGTSDIKLGGLYRLYQHHGTNIHLNIGASIPIGSIDEKDDTPMANNTKLPYPMQLGSGTYDLLPGITYYTLNKHWSWGAQANLTLRLNENDNNYTLGDRRNVTAWGAFQLSKMFSVSLRVDYHDWDEIDGSDPELNRLMAPTADPDLRGGSRTDFAFGANLLFPSGGLAGHRLAIEYIIDLDQNLDGPQLELDDTLIVGWQLAF